MCDLLLMYNDKYHLLNNISGCGCYVVLVLIFLFLFRNIVSFCSMHNIYSDLIYSNREKRNEVSIEFQLLLFTSKVLREMSTSSPFY